MTEAAHYVAAARAAARAHRLPVDAVLLPVGREARAARHLAIYLAHVVGRVPMVRLAGLAGLHRINVHVAVRDTEARRDDAAFDAALNSLEEDLVHAA